MCFWYLYHSRAQPSKLSKTFIFTMNFNDFTIQRNMIFDDFPDFFSLPFLAFIFDDFWHRFRLSFGIPLVSNSMFFIERLFDDFLNRFLIDFRLKMAPKRWGRYPPFSALFHILLPTLVPLTYVKPTSARNHFSNLFKIWKNKHTCTFYQRKTYKCAMTVFTHFKKKKT